MGRIAQLGEHLLYKQGVTGSSPVAPTRINIFQTQILRLYIIYEVIPQAESY